MDQGSDNIENLSKEDVEERLKNLQANDDGWEQVSNQSLSMSPSNSEKNDSSYKDSDKKVHIRRYGDPDITIEFSINKEVSKAQLCQSYGISNQECIMIFLDYDLLCILDKPESSFNPQKVGDYITVFQSDFVGIGSPRTISAHLRILDGDAKSENVIEILKEDLFALIKDEDDKEIVDDYIEKKKWNLMTRWAKTANSVDIQEIVTAFIEESEKAPSIPVKAEKEQLDKINYSPKPTGKRPASTEVPPENKDNKTSDESGEDEDSSEDEKTDEEESDTSSSEQSEKEEPIRSESAKQMTPQERFLSFYEKEGMTMYKEVIVSFMNMKKWDAIQNIVKNNALLSKAFTEFLDDYKVQNPGELVNIVSTPPVLEDLEPEISQPQPEQVILADPVEFSSDLFDFDDVINILLLGVTGVGKSTFINAFANYLRYKTLAEARSKGPIIVMPVKFNSTDEDLNPVEISCKPTIEITKVEKANEVLNVGQSCTQHAKTYLFQLGPASKQAIRFIDTPGVGDSRGGSVDDKNFRETLAFLGGYSRIGAILVLMRPDESRDGVHFSYCFEELLTHLHFSAIKNIIFCFTCTRKSQFTPGSTLGTLQERLKILNEKKNLTNDEGLWTKKENVFCFDNESFSALCTWSNHHNVFDDENIKAFNKSWEISVKENFRLIARIKELDPHKTDSTICVNNIRNTIFAFGKPLAKLNENLQVNIDLIEKEERDLLSMQQNESFLETSFQANPNVQLLMSNTKELNKPVTVCTNELTNCTEIKIFKNKDQREVAIVNYKTKCHNPCYLSGVEREVLPSEKIKHCSTFSAYGINKCELCKCDWSKHMHIRYELIEELKIVENLKLKAELEACSDKKEKLQKVIDDRKNMRQEMEEEREMINQILARLVAFIRRNSANAYNDSFREYTKQLIREARKKKARGGDSQLVKKLEDALEEYDAQVAEFMKVPVNKEEKADIQEINDLVVKLRGLKYCKSLLNQTEELEKKSVAQENNRKEIKVPIDRARMLNCLNELSKEDQNKIRKILNDEKINERAKINSIAQLTSNKFILDDIRLYLEEEKLTKICKNEKLPKKLHEEFKLVLMDKALDFEDKSVTLIALIPPEMVEKDKSIREKALNILIIWNSYIKDWENEESKYEVVLKQRLLCPIHDEHGVLKHVKIDKLAIKSLIDHNDNVNLKHLLGDTPLFNECLYFIKNKKKIEDFVNKIPEEYRATLSAILRDEKLRDNEKIQLFKHALPKNLKDVRKNAKNVLKEMANNKEDYLQGENKRKQLSELVAKLNSLPDVSTFLLLGQSGAGKSTFINALANFLRHLTIEEAKSDIQILISVLFEHVDMENQLKQTKIEYNMEDANESLKTGAAGTLDTKVYEFWWNVGGTKKIIRFIDTPGIADPKGVFRDLENLKKIFSTLSAFDEISGICLLLNKDNKLTAQFKYVLAELFSRLPKSAASNIMYCFTRTRETFYKPGDTLPLIREFAEQNKIPITLHKSNTFCFDNESFRFLCAWRAGIKFNPDHIVEFRNSWKQSFDHYFKMLEASKLLYKFAVADALILGNARAFLYEICGRIYDILEEEQLSNDNIKGKEAQIKDSEHAISCIKRRCTKKTTIQVDLGRIDTVCGTCIEPDQYIPTLQWHKDPPCHKDCDCNLEIQLDIADNIKIQDCSCFEWTTLAGGVQDKLCKQCNHHFRCHKQVSKTLKHVEKEELKPADIEEIESLNDTIAEAKNDIVRYKENVAKEQKEAEDLKNHANTLANYIVKHAITSCNIAVSSYLDMEIKSHTDNDTMTERLVRLKAIQEEMKSVLQRANGVALSGEELTNFMKQLKPSLKESINLYMKLKRIEFLEKNTKIETKKVKLDLNKGWLGAH